MRRVLSLPAHLVDALFVRSDADPGKRGQGTSCQRDQSGKRRTAVARLPYCSSRRRPAQRPYDPAIAASQAGGSEGETWSIGRGLACQLGKSIAMLALTLLPAVPSGAADAPPPRVSASTWPAPRADAITGPHSFSKNLSGIFNGKKLIYRAVLEETILRDRQGRPASSIFSTSFIAASAAADRPVVFVFNGGPGGASNALMFGALGPWRMTPFDSRAQADPTAPVVGNQSTILDTADLVFYDPPETGFGRPLPGTDPKTFRSNDADSFAAAEFILHWLDTHRRRQSPVYLVGESYGTHRAVMLARDLRAAQPGLEVAGLYLISQGLTYNGPPDRSVQHLPDPLRTISHLEDAVPLAWYHGLIDNRSQTLDQALDAARDYARTGYASAILRGNRLSPQERAAVAQKLAGLIGLPASYFLANDLRVGNVRRDLLASRGLSLGQLDGRETEPAAGLVADANRDWDKMFSGLTAAMENFVGRTFGQTGLPAYRTIVPDPYGFEDTWRYIEPPQPGLDVVLDEQLRANPKLRVVFAIGLYDTTSSMGGTEMLVDQLHDAGGRVRLAYYSGGHMLYTDDKAMKALDSDIRNFVRSTR